VRNLIIDIIENYIRKTRVGLFSSNMLSESFFLQIWTRLGIARAPKSRSHRTLPKRKGPVPLGIDQPKKETVCQACDF
jgi:hypothetical protein